jgi:hypothetical protein
MEIIGNGMIARGLLRYSADVNDAVVFASGVSDSTLKDRQEYDREYQMLCQVIQDCEQRDKTLVYFSSGDWQRFKNMFKQLLEPATAAKYSTNARRYAQENHDICRIIEQYKQILLSGAKMQRQSDAKHL